MTKPWSACGDRNRPVYLLKPLGLGELKAGIKLALIRYGHSAWWANSPGGDAEKLPHELLSDREYEILCLIASGKTPTEMARELSLSVKTMSTYHARILEKMNLTSNAQLTHYAIKGGLVE